MTKTKKVKTRKVTSLVVFYPGINTDSLDEFYEKYTNTAINKQEIYVLEYVKKQALDAGILTVMGTFLAKGDVIKLKDSIEDIYYVQSHPNDIGQGKYEYCIVPISKSNKKEISKGSIIEMAEIEIPEFLFRLIRDESFKLLTNESLLNETNKQL